MTLAMATSPPLHDPLSDNPVEASDQLWAMICRPVQYVARKSFFPNEEHSVIYDNSNIQLPSNGGCRIIERESKDPAYDREILLTSKLIILSPQMGTMGTDNWHIGLRRKQNKWSIWTVQAAQTNGPRLLAAKLIEFDMTEAQWLPLDFDPTQQQQKVFMSGPRTEENASSEGMALTFWVRDGIMVSWQIEHWKRRGVEGREILQCDEFWPL